MPDAPPVTTATRVIESAIESPFRFLFVDHVNCAAGRQGLAGQRPALCHLVVVERVVVVHPGAALDNSRHARSAGAGSGHSLEPSTSTTAKPAPVPSLMSARLDPV